MKSLWNEQEAAGWAGDLGQRVYTSRLLGRDPSLVLHGGGNTSVKIAERNLLGDEETLLYVKGSGWDLEHIEPAGFAPVRLAPLQRLARLDSLSDSQMVAQLRAHCTLPAAPAPSVEAILHAVLPYRYVDHTHADAVLAITNTAGGEARIREIYGDEVVIVPYVMPGFDLAREVARRFPLERGPRTRGMILLNHGVFSFGETARESYERMIALVSRAQAWLAVQGAWELPPAPESPPSPARQAVAELRADLSRVAGFPMILRRNPDPRCTAFARRDDVARVSQQGPATPDHVIRTRRLPMLGRDADAYAAAYRDYFSRNEPRARERKRMLDPAPRVVLDPELGMLAAGRRAIDTRIVCDLYEHTVEVILRAEALGGYRALSEGDIFDMEYWELEQAKLGRGGSEPPFLGEVALVTGAASGIGRACVAAFRARGAAVVGLDRDPAVTGTASGADYLGIACDITDRGAVAAALDRAADAFGGLDMLVLNAGVFPPGRRIEALDDGHWQQVMAVNLDANLALMRACHPLLKLAPAGGRVVAIASKNVPAPGPGVAAYSASKAALTQLARVAALEWGADRIRVNVIHPNAVFDTALWSEEVLRNRAAHYGVSVAEYRTRNVLGLEVGSRHVAEMAAEMCGPLFSRTTGAQVPVDGGNERVI